MNARGFTYVEVLCAVALLGMAVTAASYAVGHARTTSDGAATATTADFLLQDAFVWARSLPRIDEATSGTFGLESGEIVPDDVDDLHGIDEQPPVDRAGNAAGAAWRRTWRVASVLVDDPANERAGGSTHLLRVHVTIRRAGDEVAAGSILLARTP